MENWKTDQMGPAHMGTSRLFGSPIFQFFHSEFAGPLAHGVSDPVDCQLSIVNL